MGNKFYRAVNEFQGERVIFEPKGYYEATDEEGNVIYRKGDVIARSNEPELAASKTVGGAVLGLWSMLRHHKGVEGEEAHVYEITEEPQKDLSNWRGEDFPWLKEVRYSKPVNGIYIGRFGYDDEFNRDAENFYNRLNSEPWDEGETYDEDLFHDFEKEILTMNKSNLNESERMELRKQIRQIINEAYGELERVFESKRTGRKIIVKVQGGRITEVENESGVRFPFQVGSIWNRNTEVWACNNNFFLDGEDTCPEEKIFGVRAKDVPVGHEWRTLFPNKFR